MDVESLTSFQTKGERRNFSIVLLCENDERALLYQQHIRRDTKLNSTHIGYGHMRENNDTELTHS